MATNFSSIKNDLIWIRNSEVKYLLFGAVGGFYFSPHFTPRLKYLWLGFNLFGGIAYGGMIVGHFAVGNNTDWRSIFYSSCIIEVLIFSTVISPLFTYYFREELDLILRLNTREDKRNIEYMDHLQRMKNKFVFMNILFFLDYAIMELVFLSYPLIAVNDDYLHDPNYYAIPNPFVQNIDSVKEYMGLALVLGLSSVPLTMLFCFTQINNEVVAYELYVAFINLCSRIAKFSRHSEMIFDEINERYACLDSEIGNVFYERAIEAERQNLMRNMAGAMKIHQKLSR